MSGSTADRIIDALARRVAGGASRSAAPVPGLPGEGSLDRASLLRAGAVGIAAFWLRGVPSAMAAPAGAASGCTGGSLKACYGTIEKNFDRLVRSLCDTLKDNKGDPFGTASYACYVNWLEARGNARKDCRSSCPKPKGPKGPKSPGGGGGGTTAPPGGGGHVPTCGQVDCATGDHCCPSENGPICCVVCCAKGGNGCGSSDTDC